MSMIESIVTVRAHIANDRSDMTKFVRSFRLEDNFQMRPD